MTDKCSPVFPGVPPIESPLVAAFLEGADLTPFELEIATALSERGYAVIDFPDPEFSDRAERIKRELAPSFGMQAADVIEGGLTVHRIQDAWTFNADVQAIAANPEILRLLSKLYGRRAFPFQTLNFPVGTQQHLHSDAVHFSSIPERFMCGVWVAMEDIHADAGPLCYAPGSHKWPIVSNAMIGRRGWESELQSAQLPFHEAWRALIAAHGAQEEVFLARKGQALIWCANLLHGGSRQNNTHLTRWSQVTHYYFDDCVYYTPAFSDEPLGRLALRSITNVADGQPVPNLYLGERHDPPPPAPPAKAKLFSKGRKALRRLFFGSSVK